MQSLELVRVRLSSTARSGTVTQSDEALFLVSDEASYVDGQAIPVDGGLTASMPYAGRPI